MKWLGGINALLMLDGLFKGFSTDSSIVGDIIDGIHRLDKDTMAIPRVPLSQTQVKAFVSHEHKGHCTSSTVKPWPVPSLFLWRVKDLFKTLYLRPETSLKPFVWGWGESTGKTQSHLSVEPTKRYLLMGF